MSGERLEPRVGMTGGHLDGEGSLQMLPGKSSCIGIFGSGFARVVNDGSLSTRVSINEISELNQELTGPR